MSLPTEWTFPLNEERLSSGNPRLIGDYLRELIYSLDTMYQDLSQASSGDIREFKPQIFGYTSSGIGTYVTQDGWYLRKGLLVDYWFSVSWSAHTGTGPIYIQLPYKVKSTISNPFVGHVHGQYNYAATYNGMFGIPVSNTFEYKLYVEGPTGTPTAELGLLTSGSLIGHIRYIGQEIEN